MLRITFLLGLTLFSALPHLGSAEISLSCPATDVLQGTSVDCAWTANLTDPETFSLVMQFSNLGPAFGLSNPVQDVTRGGKTSGALPNIKNVVTLGLHRLAVFSGPLQASAVSPGFLVVAANSTSGSASSSGTATSSTSTSATTLTPPTPSASTSISRSGTNHSTIIAIAVALCAALVLGILGIMIFLHRRRRVQSREHDLLGGEPYPFANGSVLNPPGSSSAPGMGSISTLGSSSAPSVVPRRTKAEVVAEMRGPRLQDDVPPPGSSSAPSAAPRRTKAAVMAEIRGPRLQDDVPPPAYFSV
ncbi:hypothetical protein DFH09DRAFT_1375289 [Mycena vulgaris]|nr:hypothetical protein DFH09DRAFT_1375289 [Mycena vulgaris]